MKIHKITVCGETYYICANTLFEALLHLIDVEGYVLSDFTNEDDIFTIPEDEWSKNTIKYSEPEKFELPFSEYMETANSVEIFASSTYE